MILSTGQVGSEHWKTNHAKSGHQNGRASAELTGIAAKTGAKRTAHEHRTREERPITNSSREAISIDKVKTKHGSRQRTERFFSLSWDVAIFHLSSRHRAFLFLCSLSLPPPPPPPSLSLPLSLSHSLSLSLTLPLTLSLALILSLSLSLSLSLCLFVGFIFI